MSSRSTKRAARGVSAAAARELVSKHEGVVAGRKYGYPAYLVDGNFFARFRDDDTVLVLRVASIDERELLMQVDPDAFFFTDHYRNYPAVLIRLAAVRRDMLADLVARGWRATCALAPKGRQKSPAPRTKGAAVKRRTTKKPS